MDHTIQQAKYLLIWAITGIADLVSLGFLFTNADMLLKAFVSIPMGCWTIWKFVCEYRDRKERKKIKP